jgi:bifunctional oligoribonuclease and PAP phosphatase NrnA
MRLDAASRFIDRNSNFIITAHETPDGDALGSEYALYCALCKLGKHALICNADPMSDKYRFLDTSDIIKTLDELESNNTLTFKENLAEWALIILDTNDTHNIGMIAERILPFTKEYLIIDHHEQGEDNDRSNIIEENASSTCEVLFELFEELDVEIDFETAQALYVGIIYDTGCFVYPKTSARTFEIAHILVALGVKPNFVYSKVYESNSISSLRLQSQVLASLELVYDQHVAIQTMLKETIAECGAQYEEADTIINIPLKSGDILVSIFFKENEEEILRCSMRSKGNINVAEIAQFFGGGGHKTAAGFKSKYPLDEIKPKVLDMLRKYF